MVEAEGLAYARSAAETVGGGKRGRTGWPPAGPPPPWDPARRLRVGVKLRAEYAAGLAAAAAAAPPPEVAGDPSGPAAPAKASTTGKLVDSVRAEQLEQARAAGGGEAGGGKQLALAGAPGGFRPPVLGSDGKEYTPSAIVARRQASKWPRPEWHPPWKLYRVVSGHMGWVRSVAFEPGNEWFCTGSADRTIKVWDLASGQLKLTLTGHIEQVTGLAVSPRHPYLFSCGLDKTVKCWDLEYNKVIRNYHGHLSGVYCIAMHPVLDLLFTGGRDSCCRVWDMRTKAQVHCLTGHDNTVSSLLTQGTDPQVITGSQDSTVKLWDIVAAKPMSTLTFHKKGVRAMAMHPKEYTFASGSSDNIKKFKLPNGDFLHNMLQHQRAIVNCMAVNEDNVLVTGGDNGSMWFWDWKSGNSFQRDSAIVQPGSLESEAGIFAMSFDQTGTRLVTCEADKTIKFFKEDPEATPDTHPIDFRPPKGMKRY